jgi:hypothetical protein
MRKRIPFAGLDRGRGTAITCQWRHRQVAGRGAKEEGPVSPLCRHPKYPENRLRASALVAFRPEKHRFRPAVVIATGPQIRHAAGPVRLQKPPQSALTMPARWGVGIMFKYAVLLSVVAFAAPGLAIAADNPPSFPNDPPANTFNGPKLFPPGLGAPPPGCSVLATDPDDRNGSNGDDRNGSTGNPHCQLQPASR